MTTLNMRGEDSTIVNNGITFGVPWVADMEGPLYNGVSGDLIGTARDDLILAAGSGVDVLRGTAGNDFIFYDDGGITHSIGRQRAPTSSPARITGDAGNDFISGSEINDILEGGTGMDTLLYSWSMWGVTVDLLAGTGEGGSASGDVISGFEVVFGSRHADQLLGGNPGEVLRGGDGHDLVAGRNGDDVLVGGYGNDTLYGGMGNDTLLGGPGIDSLSGGGGDDYLFGFGRGSLLDGGFGIDKVSYHTATGAVTANLTAGTVSVAGFATDRLTGIEQLVASDQNDTITGSDANEWLHGLSGMDSLFGLNGHDSLRGGAGADHLRGAVGKDVLQGEDGADWMHGGNGNDSLYGGAGDDWLDGGLANDRIVGGDGADVFVFQNVAAVDRNSVGDFTDGVDVVQLRGFGLTSSAQLADYASTVDGTDLRLDFGRFEIKFQNTTLAQLTDDVVLI